MTELNRNYQGFDFESPVYRFAPLETQASNCLCVPIVYGQIKAAGNKIWQDSGTSTFNAIVSFADGPITGFSSIQINDYDISTLTGCAAVPYIGDGSKSVNSVVPTTTNKFPTNMLNLVGGLKYNAYLALSLTAGTKVANNYMNVTAVMTGKPVNVYTTTTAYTNQYSNNPIWCMLDFLTCYNGCGLTVDQIDLQSFINAASYCDAQIPFTASGTVSVTKGSTTVTGTNTLFTIEANIGDIIAINGQNYKILTITSDTQLAVDPSYSSITTTASIQTMTITDARFSLNLILDERKTRLQWLNEILIACRGYLIYNNGLLAVKIEQNDTVLDSYTPNDIISGSEVFWTTPKDKSADILKVQYIDPNRGYARLYASVEAPIYLNSPPLIQEIQALGVTNFKQASRLAWFYLNQIKTCNKFISFKTTKKALDRTVGDLIQITSSFMGYVNKKMRICRMMETQDGQIQLICREYNGFSNATLTTNLTNANSNLTYTSVAATTDANSITIQYTDPYAFNKALSVTVSGNTINVSLATNATGAITTTANQIMTAIVANASALVSVSLASGNDGSGVVTAMAQTNLTSGNDGIYTDQLGTDPPVVNVVSLIDVLSAPDDIQNFSTSQNANSIILTWQPVLGANITYEIREGASWNQSSVIATNLTDSSYTVLNIQMATYKYWICAVNKYGTYSTNPKLSTIVVSSIPETNTILNENIINSDLSSATFSNCYTNQNGIALNPIYNWADSCTWSNSGQVYAPDGFWGANCGNSGSFTTKVYDLTSNLSAIISTNYDLYSVDSTSNVLIEWQYSQDNISWSGWQTFSQGSYTFRYYQFRITINSPNNKFTALTSFIINIDITNRDLYFNDQVISNANTGITVNFNPTFIFSPAVVANISDGTSGYCVISAKSTSQATIMAYNNSGTLITAKVDIRVKGY